MAGLAQTIAVFDKSGKVVSSSKHLLGVFREAKSAYRERKAEILADKKAKHVERALAAFSIDDSRTVASSRGGPRRSRSVARHPGESHHHRSGDFVHHRSSNRYEQDLHSTTSSHFTYEQPPTELSRRHTSHDITVAQPRHPGRLNRSYTTPHVDMDLAYGDFHHSSLERGNHSPKGKLDGLVKKAKMLLVEADCAQHSVTATIAHLQKNPQAMAAVALTLAEISNLVTKMSPGALAALRSGAPSVFALLASPQFMIAAGVGIGVTIVMFGGYKIIKQIRAADKMKRDGMDEMMELNSDLSRVEMWRRGVADVGARSVGTSVDGEFITPTAAAMSGIVAPDRVSELRAPRGSYRERDAPSETASDYSHGSRVSRTSRATRRSRALTEASGKDKKGKKKSDKKKKPSPLRLLFK